MTLEEQLSALKKDLEAVVDTKSKAEVKSAIDAFEAKAKGMFTDEIKAMRTSLEEEYKAAIKVVQDHADKLDLKLQAKDKSAKKQLKFIGDAIVEAIEEKASDIAKIQQGESISIKVVGTMTTSASLTGDPVQTYNTRQGIIPAQAINVRDLISTAQSATGQYVTYRETGGEGAFDYQTTEGTKKPQVDYDFSEIKTVTKFLAGTVDFSRQLITNLPWMQTTLNRMLQRDFFKKENSLFYSAMLAAATGPNTSAYTVAAEQLVDYIMKFRDTDFMPSYIVMNNATFSTLALTKPMDYSTPFVFVVNPVTGQVEIDGIPVIRASWATTGKVLIFDADYVERVETVGMNLRFSDQNKDNFEKNLITARLECQEELNIMLPSALVNGNLTVTT